MLVDGSAPPNQIWHAQLTQNLIHVDYFVVCDQNYFMCYLARVLNWVLRLNMYMYFRPAENKSRIRFEVRMRS